MSILPRMLSETSSESCLASAVAAVSYANFHGRCTSREAREASSIHYGKALQKLAITLTDYAVTQQAEVLMAVYLLSLYEVNESIFQCIF